MKLLIKILSAAHCRSTHHFFAMDALPLVTTLRGQKLCRALVHHHEAYLIGAKDPDKTFRDFRNHVLHVADNDWGGAMTAAEKWYRKLLAAMESLQWEDAAYTAGVLSHYFTDPMMPLHTAQSSRESVYHRPLEWSVTKSYRTIRRRWKSTVGAKQFPLPNGPQWLSHAIRQGAVTAHRSYEELLDRYDLKRGAKTPEAGFDSASIDILARIFGMTIPGWAQVIERAADESRVEIPHFPLSMTAAVAAMDIPSQWVVRRMESEAEREAVQAIFDEYESTGKVVKHLPQEVVSVREERESDRIREEASDAVAAAEVRANRVRRPDLVVSVTTSPPKETLEKKRDSSSSTVTSLCNEPTNNSSTPTAVTEPPSSRARDIQALTEPTTDSTTLGTGDSKAIPLSVVSESSSDQTFGASESKTKPAETPITPVPETAEKDSPPELDQATTKAPATIPFDSRDQIREKFVSAVEQMRKDNHSKALKRERQKAINERLRAARERRNASRNAGQIPGPIIVKPAPIETRKLAVPTVPKANPNRRKTDVSAKSASTSINTSPRRSLSLADDLVDAPSIGPKTAKRFERLGITTVGQFLSAAPDEMAAGLKTSWINEGKLRDWQDQARLVCALPGICGYKSQLLVGVGLRDVDAVAKQNASSLHSVIVEYAATSAGKRILRSGRTPDLAEITKWVRNAIDATSNPQAA